MRRILVIVAVVVFGSALAYSQLPSVTFEVTQVNGWPTIHITNNGTEPLEALLLVADNGFGPAGDWHRTYFDVHMHYVQKTEQPIQPGGTKDFPLVCKPGGTLPVVRLVAAIFSDGSTEGSEDSLNELLRRRAIAINELNNLRSVLSGAIRSKLPAVSTKTRILDSCVPIRKKTPPPGYRWEDLALEQQTQDWAVGFLDSRTTPSSSSKPESHVFVQQLARHVDTWLSDLQNAKPTLAGDLKPSNTGY